MSASVRRARESNDLQRSAGGLLFAVGALVVLLRSANAPHWTEFERVMVISAPVVLLYALAIGRGSASESTGSPRGAAPWRSVLLVTAILLAPIALLALLNWLGVDTNKWSVQAAAAVATAALAFDGARRARAPYAVLVAGLALLIAWLILWSKIISHPSTSDYRWLLAVGAALLFSAAAGLSANNSLGAGEMTIAGAIAAVLAGSIGVLVGGLLSVARAALGSLHGLGGAFAGSALGFHNGLQDFGWDLYLLLVSVLLVWVGSRLKARGLGYVGGFGLFAFVISVGSELTRVAAGHAPSHSLLGWPIVLVVLGLLALFAPAGSSGRS